MATLVLQSLRGIRRSPAEACYRLPALSVFPSGPRTVGVPQARHYACHPQSTQVFVLRETKRERGASCASRSKAPVARQGCPVAGELRSPGSVSANARREFSLSLSTRTTGQGPWFKKRQRRVAEASQMPSPNPSVNRTSPSGLRPLAVTTRANFGSSTRPI